MAEQTTEPVDAAHTMTCMEIWGGNRATRRSITLPGLDAWICCRPYQQADSGGDVYYVSNCATGRITRLMLADVSGHGSAVAKTANHLRLLMRRYVNHIQQLKFVSSMNDEFTVVSQAGGFATAVVATFLAPNRQLTFSNAGHPCPLIYTARDHRWRLLETLPDENGKPPQADSLGLPPHERQELLINGQSEVPQEPPQAVGLGLPPHENENLLKNARSQVPQERHGPSDLPLGIFEHGTYAELKLRLEVGDLVLFYTDAFIESRGPNGDLLGSDAFLDLVAALDATHPESLPEQIVAKVTSLYPGNLLDDDVTLLLFRPTGEDSHVPFKNRVMAPFRLLKGVASSLLNGGRGMPLPEFSLANLGIGSMEEPKRGEEKGR